MTEKESAEKAKKETASTKSEKTTEKNATKPKAKSSGGSKKTAKKAKVETVVRENSLVYVDYVGRTKDDGEVFDTTLEDVARENGLYKEDSKYEPYLVAIGWNWLLPILEKAMIGMAVGETKTIEVPPEEGPGVRKPELVKKIPLVKIRKRGARGYKGEEITFGNEKGVITHVLGRTVLVDFNNPMADKTWVFDVTVKEILSNDEDKLKAIIKRRLPGLPEDEYSAKVTGKTVTIELPWRGRYLEHANYADIGIAQDALKIVEKAKEVKIVITWPRPEPQTTDAS